MKILGVIPSRYASTRFPGKPLADIAGKSMVNRVYDQALKSGMLNKVVVATDDSRIYDHVASFGGNVMMTSENHLNGTTRCFEVYHNLKNKGEEYDVIINIQGDEPMIDPSSIDKVANIFYDQNAKIGTLVKEISHEDELFNPNVVKAIIDNNDYAIYFSREALPYLRNEQKINWLSVNTFYKHIGIYGFRNEVLTEIIDLPVGKLEKAESLEQLRWVENNIAIKVNFTDFESIGIDTPDDLIKLETKY